MWIMLCALEYVKRSWQPPLTKIHILKLQNWAKKYMKIYFSKLIFPGASHVTFDWPDGWPKAFILSYSKIPVVKRRQQGDSSLMTWAGIVDQNIFESFKINYSVKLDSANYCYFINYIFLAWYNSQSHNFKVNCVLMYDNAYSHIAKLTWEFLELKIFTEEKIMGYPPSSSYLDPIQILWSVVKMKLYKGGEI